MKDIVSIFDASRSANDSSLTLPFILWTIIFGIIISWIIIFYNKRIVGAFVRAIIKAEALNAESAKTLSELGQENNISAISHFRSSEALRRIVFIANPVEQSDKTAKSSKKQRVFVDENTRFYIPEEQLVRASNMYDSRGTNIFAIIGGTLAMLALGVIITYFTM